VSALVFYNAARAQPAAAGTCLNLINANAPRPNRCNDDSYAPLWRVSQKN